MMNTRKCTVQVVTRAEWGAQPPREGVAVDDLAHPVENVIFNYDTDTTDCFDKSQCSSSMRALQKKFMSQGLADIPYNFVVGGDLYIYEGRGWTKKPEKNEKFPLLNDSSIEVAFIGDKRELGMLYQMLRYGLELLAEGKKKKYIIEEYNLLESKPKLQFSPGY